MGIMARRRQAAEIKRIGEPQPKGPITQAVEAVIAEHGLEKVAEALDVELPKVEEPKATGGKNGANRSRKN
jgi:hypothetical protein